MKPAERAALQRQINSNDDSNSIISSLTRGRHLTIGRHQVKFEHVMAAYMLGRSGIAVGQKVRNKVNGYRNYGISIPDDDILFDVLMPWLLSQIDDSKKRSLSAQFDSRRARKAREYERYSGSVSPDDDESGPKVFKPQKLVVAYDGARTHKVDIDGHTVLVSVMKDEDASRRGSDENGVSMSMSRGPIEKLYFQASSKAGRDAVLAMLEGMVSSIELTVARTARLWTMNSWGSWDSCGTLPPRPLHSVVSRDNIAQTVAADLEKFLASEERYLAVSAPYHRGYLFHGPPGTGKTSLARALASHFNLDMHYMPLASVKGDVELTQRLGQISAGILLLEDIDVFHSTRSRTDDSEGGVTLSGLLNALDGAATPHGLIVVMTTNDRSVLDSAVVRPGRVDLEVEMGLVGIDEVSSLFDLFYGVDDKRHVDWGLKGRFGAGWEIAPAEITSRMLANMDSPADALAAIIENEETPTSRS